MLYLTLQIALILFLAVITGLGIGWWVRGGVSGLSLTKANELPENPFDARFRLEQCHRDNSTLRRDLKEAEEKAEKLQIRIDNAANADTNMLERLEEAEGRVHALLDDLQLRDDTIAALEHELSELRSKA